MKTDMTVNDMTFDDYAAACMGTFIGMLSERYTDKEIFEMLQKKKVEQILKIVKDKEKLL